MNPIKNFTTSPSLHMVSIDVTSLFTHVSAQDALQCLTVRLKEFHYTDYEINDIIELFSICLTQIHFNFEMNFIL